MLKFIIILCFLHVVLPNEIKVPPPPHEKTAEMARYIMKHSDWVALSTISTQESIKGFPFATLKSVSDGPLNNNTGIPYLYMTDLDLSGKDVKVDNRVTIMCSLEEVDYCKIHAYDPQDPRCAKLMISGKLLKVDHGTEEYDFGYKALLAKHPEMEDWPSDHGFYLAKIEIKQILVLDYFGGVKPVNLEDYFNANKRFKSLWKHLIEKIKITRHN